MIIFFVVFAMFVEPNMADCPNGILFFVEVIDKKLGEKLKETPFNFASSSLAATIYQRGFEIF